MSTGPSDGALSRAPFQVGLLNQSMNPTGRITTSAAFSRCGNLLCLASEDDLLHVVASSPVSIADVVSAGSEDPVIARYFLERTGVSQCVFAGADPAKVLFTPRNRSASDVLRLDIDTGRMDAAYHALDAVDESGEQGGGDETSDFCALAHSPTLDVFCSAKEEGYCSFFSSKCGQAIAALREPLAGTSSVDFSNDGRQFCVADKRYVRIYDWRRMTKGPLALVEPQKVDESGNVCGVHFHPTANRLLLTSSNMACATVDLSRAPSSGSPLFEPRRLWVEDVEVQRELEVLNVHFMRYKRRLTCTARWSPDGAHIAVGTAASVVMVLNGRSEEHELQCKWRPHKATVTHVAWNPKYSVLATTCQNHMLWNYESKDVRPLTPANRSPTITTAAPAKDARTATPSGKDVRPPATSTVARVPAVGGRGSLDMGVLPMPPSPRR